MLLSGSPRSVEHQNTTRPTMPTLEDTAPFAQGPPTSTGTRVPRTLHPYANTPPRVNSFRGSPQRKTPNSEVRLKTRFRGPSEDERDDAVPLEARSPRMVRANYRMSTNRPTPPRVPVSYIAWTEHGESGSHWRQHFQAGPTSGAGTLSTGVAHTMAFSNPERMSVPVGVRRSPQRYNQIVDSIPIRVRMRGHPPITRPEPHEARRDRGHETRPTLRQEVPWMQKPQGHRAGGMARPESSGMVSAKSLEAKPAIGPEPFGNRNSPTKPPAKRIPGVVASPAKRVASEDVVEGLVPNSRQNHPTSESKKRLLSPRNHHEVFKKARGFDKLDLLCSATLEMGALQDNPSGCSCPKSKCVALYCDCFKAGRRCNPSQCTCLDCKNTIDESGPNGARTKAIRSILARNPRAFTTAGIGNPLLKLPPGEIACNCVRSRCLKLYCSCFHNGKVCRPGVCTCVGCYNTESDDNGHRQAAIQQALEKRPDAFQIKPREKGLGCACKNNRCIRKYCECFRNKLECSDRCSCRQCENGKGPLMDHMSTSREP